MSESIQLRDDNADALLGQLTVITRKETEESTQKIESVKVNITSTLNGAMDGCKTEVTTKVDPLVIEINGLVDEANKAGLDTGSCTKEISLVTQVPYSVLNDVVFCITNLLNDLLAVISEALKTVTGLLSIVTDLTTELRKCGGLLGVVCIAKVVAKITLQITQIPLKAAGVVTNVLGLVAKAKLGLDACAIGKVAKAVVTAVSTAATIISCLTKLLGR